MRRELRWPLRACPLSYNPQVQTETETYWFFLFRSISLSTYEKRKTTPKCQLCVLYQQRTYNFRKLNSVLQISVFHSLEKWKIEQIRVAWTINIDQNRQIQAASVFFASFVCVYDLLSNTVNTNTEKMSSREDDTIHYHNRLQAKMVIKSGRTAHGYVWWWRTLHWNTRQRQVAYFYIKDCIFK